MSGSIALSALLFAAAAGGCGANMQAVYEGDVRFEHCMALDWRSDVKPNIRRRCWIEWVGFYTYGQTRDRVAHAELRIRELAVTIASTSPPGSPPRALVPGSGPPGSVPPESGPPGSVPPTVTPTGGAPATGRALHRDASKSVP